MAASEAGQASTRFLNGPVPTAGPDVPYQNEASSNPVLRGSLLAIATTLITSSSLVQGVLWKANKFDKLKEIEHLKKYEPRLDPTVTPIRESTPAAAQELPQPTQRSSTSAYYTSADYYALYKARRLTPSDVVEVLLPLVRRDTTPAGKHSIAFLDSRVDHIKSKAKESTHRHQNGRPLSFLDGVPIAVKDEMDITRYKRTLASPLDFTHPEDATSWCVQMLEDAGALVIGKTNMHELGLDTTNNNPNTGTPLNPHNASYYTGGSSGGSAYTAAAGLCPITLGSDGGGSIRLPASFCGVYGLKPTHNRVSGTDLPSSVTVYGPLAANVADLALAYRIMAKPDPNNPHSALFPDPLHELSLSQPAGKKYLGIFSDWVNRSDPTMKSFFSSAINHYTTQHNYEKVSITIPFLSEGQKAHALTIVSESRSILTTSQISKLTYLSQLLLTVIGNHASAQDLLAAQKLRDLLMKHLASLWKQHPGLLIVTPTVPVPGWAIGKASDVKKGGYGVSDGDKSLRSMEYVYLANFVGAPSISIPMGYAETQGGDVPVGIMAMGEWGSEEQLLTWAKEGESMLQYGVQRPKGEDAWVDVIAEAAKIRGS